jgi:hypothetical protein
MLNSSLSFLTPTLCFTPIFDVQSSSRHRARTHALAAHQQGEPRRALGQKTPQLARYLRRRGRADCEEARRARVDAARETQFAAAESGTAWIKRLVH